MSIGRVKYTQVPPLDVVALGSAVTDGEVESLPDARIAIRTPGLLRVFDREEFFEGDAAEPMSELRLGEGERGAPLPDGGFVVADGNSVRAVTRGGSTRWRLAHDPWHGSGEALGNPAVSADGALVSVFVPNLAKDYTGGRAWLADDIAVLDAATCAVVERAAAQGTSQREVQRWHPERARLAISMWVPWGGWMTWWGLAREGGFRFVGGAQSLVPVGFLPGTDRLVTRRWPDFPGDEEDDFEELAIYDIATGAPIAQLDTTELNENACADDFPEDAVLDADRVLTVLRPSEPHASGPARRTHVHWVLDSAELRPLGQVHYPVPAGESVIALGDGTWLTRHGDELHRWRLTA
ncbi:hypothetical protein LTV02_20850 [Nocardia yamanashiensis]|uniref:hypothetical protein n=1 Tax=Nocardia yamanashiensis TaxID=209247 RepID=UPI001E373AEF|nr:hypothetical protein [Nocardia yamanashiensis]UGT38589.1 hypothetical protein LTV02_20850 [Nocardia yamanashiensis]